MSTFEGSYLGDDARLTDTTRLECKVCWLIYDPATGDAEFDIPPGIPFSRLPEDWVCPRCYAAKHQFMVIPADTENE